MSAKRQPISIEDLNDKVAGRLAREAELARIREAKARLGVVDPPPRAPGRAGFRPKPVSRRRVPGQDG